MKQTQLQPINKTNILYPQDANDNAPVFAQTTAYYIFQVPDLAAGRFVGQVTAADSDRSTQYSNIYYSFLVNPFSKGFMVINDFGTLFFGLR